IFVFAEENSLWIDAIPGYEDLLFAHLDKYLITEDVQFARRSAEYVEIYASGPEVLSRLSALGLPCADLTVQRHFRSALGSTTVSVRRVDWLAGPGCLIQVPASESDAVWNTLTAGGLVPVGRAV